MEHSTAYRTAQKTAQKTAPDLDNSTE
jgi:hypothetical protein